MGAVEITHWLRGLAAVTEDWSSVPLPTADSSQPPVNPALGGLIPSSSLYKLPNTTERYTFTHKQKQRKFLGVILYINSLKKKKSTFLIIN